MDSPKPDSTTIEHLIECLDSREGVVRIRARRLLVRAGAHHALSTLAGRFACLVPVVETLERLNPETEIQWAAYKARLELDKRPVQTLSTERRGAPPPEAATKATEDTIGASDGNGQDSDRGE